MYAGHEEESMGGSAVAGERRRSTSCQTDTRGASPRTLRQSKEAYMIIILTPSWFARRRAERRLLALR